MLHKIINVTIPQNIHEFDSIYDLYSELYYDSMGLLYFVFFQDFNTLYNYRIYRQTYRGKKKLHFMSININIHADTPKQSL
jgi:hypothetical protein